MQAEQAERLARSVVDTLTVGRLHEYAECGLKHRNLTLPVAMSSTNPDLNACLGRTRPRLPSEPVRLTSLLTPNRKSESLRYFRRPLWFEGRAGPGCLNRISAAISGASAGVRPPSGMAAG